MLEGMRMKHIVWAFDCEGSNVRIHGRAGIRISNGRIQMTDLHGRNLPAVLLLPVLNAALGDNWIAEAEILHRKRVHPWRVDIHEGMSGARDYRLRVLENDDWFDMPVRACLHVSMYGKLNDGLSMWMGDLPPLLAKVLQDFPPPSKEAYSLQVYEPVTPSGFTRAGASSNLQETIESLKVMEVLADADDAS